MQRLPWARLLVLADAVGVASGAPERGHADDAGPRPPDIDPAEAQGPADRRVRAPARPEDARARIDVERPPDRAVHDHERGHRVGGPGHAEQAESVVADRLDRGEHDREAFGPAA